MTSSDPRELSGMIERVNTLGSASERFFSRLYGSLGIRKRIEAEVRKRDDFIRHQYHLIAKRDEDIEKISAVLANISEGVIVQDNEGRVIMVNKAARELLGSIKAFWESELGQLYNRYRTVTSTSELMPLNEPKQVSVNNRILGAQLGALADERGKRLGTLVLLRDVTSDVLSERLKDQFITAISHELRTPMAVIKGVSEVLTAQSEVGQLNTRLLETLSRNVDVLDRMIVELLDISELTTGGFSIRRDPLALEELLWNVIKGLQPEIKRANLDVSFMVCNTERLIVEGDDPRLRWAFGHVLQNAVRYTERGGHIIMTARLHEPDQIAVQVVDTGVGIHEKDLPHIFDRFYRGEARTPSGKLIDPRGLGQGLFIARKVAEAHGGYLSVRSQVGQGSIFSTYLPRANG
ncbi:MAG: ATP-binding protein [bacterium]|nr:ATP-binding protein [bacterium]